MAQLLYTIVNMTALMFGSITQRESFEQEVKMNNKDQLELRTFGLAGWTEKVGLAFRDRYLGSGYWRGMTFLHAAGVAGWKAGGASVWAEQGMDGFIKRVLTSDIGRQPHKAVKENKMESCFWFAFISLVALFSFSLVFLAVCLFERMGLLTM